MKKAFVITFCSSILMFGAGCSPESPKLIAKPQVVYDKIDVKGDSVDYTPVVDILFVVDRSASMAAIQNNLSNNIDLFLKSLSSMKVDYHIGVIASDGSTYNGLKDPGCGFFCTALPNTFGILQGDTKFVTPTTPNGINLLRKNILVGTNGDATEQFFDPIIKALSPDMTGVGKVNSGFIRDNAYLAVIFITDADDQSIKATVGSTFDYLVNLKKSKNKVLSYGIIIPSALGSIPSGNCSRSGEPLPYNLESFLAQTVNNKSNAMNLCDPQFGLQLAKFSKDLVRYLVGTIPLNKFPVVSSIQVLFGGKLIPPSTTMGWFYDPKENAVVISENYVMDDEGDGSGLKINFDAIPMQ